MELPVWERSTPLVVERPKLRRRAKVEIAPAFLTDEEGRKGQRGV